MNQDIYKFIYESNLPLLVIERNCNYLHICDDFGKISWARNIPKLVPLHLCQKWKRSRISNICKYTWSVIIFKGKDTLQFADIINHYKLIRSKVLLDTLHFFPSFCLSIWHWTSLGSLPSYTILCSNIYHNGENRRYLDFHR